MVYSNGPIDIYVTITCDHLVAGAVKSTIKLNVDTVSNAEVKGEIIKEDYKTVSAVSGFRHGTGAVATTEHIILS